MVSAIKIGRKIHLIKKGDYILDNGSCYQFIAGDGRTLKYIRSGRFPQACSSLVIPKKIIKTIDLTKLESKCTGFGEGKLTYYYL